MKTETESAPARMKRPEGREFYAVDFDVRDFFQKHPTIRRSAVGELLGLSMQSLDNYGKKRCPLSVYKAIIEAFAPQKAHDYELKLLVERTHRPFYITNETQHLAHQYDHRRAGQKITLADGTGFYQIAKEQAETEFVEHDREVPVGEIRESLAEETGKVVATITPKSDAPSPEVTILLQQQEALIAVLARVAKDRDEAVIEKQQLRQTLADRDASIANMGGQIARLKDSVREWEELSKAEPLKGTTAASLNPSLLVEEIVTRLKGTFAANGHPTLAKELDRISPKRQGYSSLPQQSARNGNSRNSR